MTSIYRPVSFLLIDFRNDYNSPSVLSTLPTDDNSLKANSRLTDFPNSKVPGSAFNSEVLNVFHEKKKSRVPIVW